MLEHVYTRTSHVSVNLSDNLIQSLYATKLEQDLWFCVHIYTLEFHNLKTKYGALTCVRASTYIRVCTSRV